MKWVFKLGGSLMDSGHLADWLSVLSASQGQEILIVPGGGVFADQVREVDARFGLNQRVAHEMAILATQQYGLMMASMQNGISVIYPEWPPEWHTGQSRIWLPQPRLLDRWGLGHGWFYTSDSIAAILARKMAADHLVLVKSAQLAFGSQRLSEMIGRGIVDQGFAESAGNLRAHCWLAEKDSYGNLKKALRGGDPERYCNTQIDLTN